MFQVRDGADETADLVGRYCGSEIPSPYTSTGSSLFLKFKSDPSQRGAGFRATYITGK